MPRVYTEPFELNGWPGQRIGCGPLKIVLVPSIGGRIMSLRYEGKEMMFLQKEHAGEVFDFTDADLVAKKKEIGFRLWGGDKTWVAPQSEWQEQIPPLELDAGTYALTWEGTVAVMTSPTCRETGLRIVRRVNIDEEMTLHVTDEFQNTTSDKVIRKGIWNVTQFNRPCVFFIPADKGVIRSYHHIDKSLPEVKDILKEEEGWVEVPCRENTLFKCGGMPKEGHIIAKIPLGGPKELVVLKSFQIETDPLRYAHGSAVEVFNSAKHNYAEMEVHAPVCTLNPGESFSFKQQWRFKKI
jgi:hypothetical protein